jgi:predicted transglutaminase-like cysteine proteinase
MYYLDTMGNILYSKIKYGNRKERRVTTCPVHVRERAYPFNKFIRPGDVTHIARRLKPHISSKPQAVYHAFNYVTKNIKYERDHIKHNKIDFWQFPFETLRGGTGDCEDMSFLLASILLQLGLYDVRVVVGKLNGKGHAWVEVFDGHQWLILDCTNKKIHSLIKRDVFGYEVDYNIYHWGCTSPKITDSFDELYSILLYCILLACIAFVAAAIFILS